MCYHARIENNKEALCCVHTVVFIQLVWGCGFSGFGFVDCLGPITIEVLTLLKLLSLHPPDFIRRHVQAFFLTFLWWQPWWSTIQSVKSWWSTIQSVKSWWSSIQSVKSWWSAIQLVKSWWPAIQSVKAWWSTIQSVKACDQPFNQSRHGDQPFNQSKHGNQPFNQSRHGDQTFTQSSRIISRLINQSIKSDWSVYYTKLANKSVN